jgi:spore coat polysaccharide biosynthesis protein SpsF
VLAIVLQARVDSSRLPGKALLPLGGKPMILRIMEALNRIPAELRVLACPEDSKSAFAELAGEAGFTLFAGPKEDVLDRFCLCLRNFDIRHLIRATGDNPFVFTDAAYAIITEGLALDADYAGYSGLPPGAGVESVNAKALLLAGTEATSQYDREHVCPYLYTHPEKFLLHRPLAPELWQGPEIRLTVDTQQDYEQAQVLYAELDGLEKTGKLSEGERYKGEVIIKTYREIGSRESGVGSRDQDSQFDRIGNKQ